MYLEWSVWALYVGLVGKTISVVSQIGANFIRSRMNKISFLKIKGHHKKRELYFKCDAIKKHNPFVIP